MPTANVILVRYGEHNKRDEHPEVPVDVDVEINSDSVTHNVPTSTPMTLSYNSFQGFIQSPAGGGVCRLLLTTLIFFLYCYLY